MYVNKYIKNTVFILALMAVARGRMDSFSSTDPSKNGSPLQAFFFWLLGATVNTSKHVDPVQRHNAISHQLKEPPWEKHTKTTAK